MTKEYKHIIESWRRRDAIARNLIADAADAIMQLSVMKINLTVNGKKAVDIEGTCSGTKKILKAMKTFLSSNWVDLSKATAAKVKGKKNV